MVGEHSGFADGLEFALENTDLLGLACLALLQRLVVFFQLGDSRSVFSFEAAVVVLDSCDRCQVLFVLLCYPAFHLAHVVPPLLIATASKNFATASATAAVARHAPRMRACSWGWHAAKGLGNWRKLRCAATPSSLRVLGRVRTSGSGGASALIWMAG